MRVNTPSPRKRFAGLGNSARGQVGLATGAGLLAIASLSLSPGPKPVLAAPTAVPAPSAPANPTLLLPGAEGDEVMMLQRQMRLLGIYNGPINGQYDGTTQAAIAAFQTSAQMPASGTLDQATWQRMSTPQLLEQANPAPAEQPDLFPSAAEPESGAEDSEPRAQANPGPAPVPRPAENSETEGETPIGRAGPPAWLLAGVGGLAIVALRRRGRSPTPPLSPDALAPPVQGHPPVAGLPRTADLYPPSHADGGDRPPQNTLSPWPPSATTRLSLGDIVDSLVNDLASADGAIRCQAIWALGQRGNSDAIQPLVEGLLEADSQEKSLILAALAEISSRSLKPMHRALALGLQDPSPEVRKNAIRDLSRVYDTVVQLSSMLGHATQDPDPGVQETAQWALSQLNRIPAAPYPSALPSEHVYDSDRLPPA